MRVCVQCSGASGSNEYPIFRTQRCHCRPQPLHDAWNPHHKARCINPARGRGSSTPNAYLCNSADAIYTLLCMMLISSLLALVAALFDPPLQESVPMAL